MANKIMGKADGHVQRQFSVPIAELGDKKMCQISSHSLAAFVLFRFSFKPFICSPRSLKYKIIR
ncbi:hypothetical protein I7I53_01801 [Histoplasma capsulatum var. duboisii H88]|uniref:Uncharacterized protein n=1 Tax=Ajellomyces capsulatus (strain H88) TaxID=544711 RepID=A0A8A1LIV0_AJEC8|nr:hypothetical protein I7I53_01801 [Histoplasma capsulatum var. duboisii H88]